MGTQGRVNRFSGRQAAGIAAAIAVIVVAAPVGVRAAGAGSVRIIDANHSGRAARVDHKGSLQVAVKGTPRVAVAGTAAVTERLPAGAFSYSSGTANALLATLPCGTKIAVSSFALSTTSTAPVTSAGINVITVGGSGNSGTGDLLSLTAPANGGERQLTFPVPFVITPKALGSGNTCQKVQVYEDGGTSDQSQLVLTGYAIAG